MMITGVMVTNSEIQKNSSASSNKRAGGSTGFSHHGNSCDLVKRVSAST